MARRKVSGPNYTVVFDFGGVLSHGYDPVPAIHSEVGGDLAAVETAYWEQRLAFDKGELSQQEYWQTVCAAAGIVDPSEDEILDLQDVDNRYWAQLAPGARDLLHDLARNEVRLVLLSNTNQDFGEYLRKQDWFEAFAFAIISAEEGVAKPEREIFEITLDAIAHETGGVARPNQVIFFDDSEANVTAAKALGINAHFWPQNGSAAAQEIAGWDLARQILTELNIPLD